VHVTILSVREGWHTDQLCRALQARAVTTDVRAYETLVARIGSSESHGQRHPPLDVEADAVLARIIPNGSLEQIIFRVDALHWLEDRGVRVMNSPRAIERSVDKFYTSALLEHAGLRTPETVVCERGEDAVLAFRALGDVIVKPLFGSMGLGMVRVSDEETAWRVFRALDAIRGVYYLQRAIDHGGRDVRAFVIGDRVIGAMERRASDRGPDWRTNYSRGGVATAFALPAEWAELAVRAAQVVGADYAGVDLLPARDGTVYVLEVNGIPGWQGLQTATHIDVADAIVAHLLQSLEGTPSRAHPA
jgi:RimK family alpha-L-glutamate ligase